MLRSDFLRDVLNNDALLKVCGLPVNRCEVLVEWKTSTLPDLARTIGNLEVLHFFADILEILYANFDDTAPIR